MATRGNDQVYDRKLTVGVEIVGDEFITMMDLLRGIKVACGNVIGCRFKAQKKYEITMASSKGKQRLMDGFKIKNSSIMAREISSDEMVVSFLNLPTYIEDEKIINKLTEWGVTAISPIKRRLWKGTDIVDGTRFVKVKFNQYVKSLPYSTKFETLEGEEYFRCIHDRQVKVCRLCIQPGHILRECPEFKCYKCKNQGHYARECTQSGRCQQCKEARAFCKCTEEESGDHFDQDTEMARKEEEERLEEEEESDDGDEEVEDEGDEDEDDMGKIETTDTRWATPVETQENAEKEQDTIGSSLDNVVLDGAVSDGGEIGNGVGACARRVHAPGRDHVKTPEGTQHPGESNTRRDGETAVTANGEGREKTEELEQAAPPIMQDINMGDTDERPEGSKNKDPGRTIDNMSPKELKEALSAVERKKTASQGRKMKETRRHKV